MPRWIGEEPVGGSIEGTYINLPEPKGWSVTCAVCERRGDAVPWHFRHATPFVVIKVFRIHLEQEHELECYFCFLKFPSFQELAKHVTDAHVSSEAQHEREMREAWHPDDDREENQSMSLPTPGGGKRDAERGNSGASRGNRKPPAVPFLRVEDLNPEEKNVAKILAVQTQNTGFNDVIVKIALGGRSYFFGLKASNPNYEALFNAFGENENKWVGESFTIGLNWNDFYEKNFVHVYEAPAPKQRGRPKSED